MFPFHHINHVNTCQPPETGRGTGPRRCSRSSPGCRGPGSCCSTRSCPPPRKRKRCYTGYIIVIYYTGGYSIIIPDVVLPGWRTHWRPQARRPRGRRRPRCESESGEWSRCPRGRSLKISDLFQVCML